MAAAHQDGTVAVYDMRCSAAIQQYKLDTAARNVKFSPGGGSGGLQGGWGEAGVLKGGLKDVCLAWPGLQPGWRGSVV